MFYIVGITASCKRLAICNSATAASLYIETLPHYSDGRYYIDACSDTVVLKTLPPERPVLQVYEDEGHSGPSECHFYVYEDVAELFWPDNHDLGNHTAEERVTQRMVEKGCVYVDGSWGSYKTPRGPVAFDSESGGMEWHSDERAPVEYVIEVVREIQAEMDAAR